MKVVIIDDDPSSHTNLQEYLLAHYPGIEILGSAYTKKEGLELMVEHEPDLVFLDIQLPDGTGFDLLESIGEPKFATIFITGHNDYAEQAIHAGALHFLSKPFSEERLKVAVDKAVQDKERKNMQQRYEIMLEAFNRIRQQLPPIRIAISTVEEILYREMKDIARLEAQGAYTRFYLTTGAPNTIMASLNIGKYELQFVSHPDFMKVHRSHIVNVNYIDSYLRGTGQIKMIGGGLVNVSRTFRDDLLKRLGGDLE